MKCHNNLREEWRTRDKQRSSVQTRIRRAFSSRLELC